MGTMGSDAIRRRIVVHGRVQGVFFRDCTRTQAKERALTGWASNQPDGTVEVIVEGPREAVEQLTDFCRRGPRRAQVERIEVSDGAPEGLAGFHIR
jgi:acylphosphatase